MIVTRFAPSPTGYLHIGSARTALFCWLMARRHNGKMILRIEDTDQKRSTPTATMQVMSDLQWLGIDWDEGPNTDGPNGPYLQSQRRDIYDKYIQKLLDAGLAYHCFDTSEELQAMRQKAQAAKKTFIYPRPQNFPDARDIENARAQGRPVAVRFVMDQDRDIVVNDIVRGQVTFAAGEFSDFIIRKSDGFPTYHFACVVDDELMEVTHIIRGQEHLMNTPCHLALQKALGFRTPIYAHMSVTVSENGGKLSKREPAKKLLENIKNNSNIDLKKVAEAANIDIGKMNSFIAGDGTLDSREIDDIVKYLRVEAGIEIHLPEINVVDFIKSGYIPEAMVNFVALLGWNPGDNREIMTREELSKAFDIDRLARSNSLFDREKLKAFNTEHIRMIEPNKLLEYFKKYLQVNNLPMAQADDDTLARILEVCQGARTLADVENKCRFLFADEIKFDPKAVKKVLQKDGAAAMLAEAHDGLAKLDDWTEESIHAVVEQLCQKNEVGMGKIAQPIRVAITGSTVSPGIGESLVLLGKEKTLARIAETLKYLQSL